MKARTARLHYIVTFFLAFVGVAVFSMIVGMSAVFPFAFSKIRDVIAEFLSKDGQKSVTALEAAKAKKEALKKEKAKLAKEKKKNDKKQKKLLDKRVKKIYEERVSEGYAASLNMMGATATPVAVPVTPIATVASAPVVAPAPKKAKKAKKAKKDAPVVEMPIAETATAPVLPIAPASPAPVFDFGAASGDDYRSNGSMFRGISF